MSDERSAQDVAAMVKAAEDKQKKYADQRKEAALQTALLEAARKKQELDEEARKKETP